ncbi:transmembrane amino acid transporter family protein [Apodospora peruviana]|uniref:Transmembrane amino acid transporter family protein n=1 Tax=Apodospora peruviana TaxID=516989 RepID=A0AAE0M8N9_9PEZI|nr:transmembrane amino acid transporter family protein [Apodospora peruviana]
MAVPASATMITDSSQVSHHETPGHLTHNPSVSFEEYLYYAEITRKEEEVANGLYVASQKSSTIKSLFSKGGQQQPSAPDSDTAGANEKVLTLPDGGAKLKSSSGSHDDRNGGDDNVGVITVTGVTDDEWKQASRAVRTASWGGVFYLITTDILGPTSAPWSFAQMGYGPGVALYTVFGVMSYYSGWILWKAFLALDSDRYPLRGYGDLYYRVFGAVSRHLINFAQGLQLLLVVAVLILGNGQAISQISKGPDGNEGLCFVVCLVIFMLAGFVLGQIRTLQRFSWIANIAVYLNLLCIFMVMGVAANYAPNYAATEASFGFAEGPPIVKFAGTPPDGFASGGSGFIGSLNGLNQAVYSYGGCMVFAAFLAEMRHPMDFWKSLLIAEVFIYAVYMFFGMFVYSYQGQFTYNPAHQGLSPYSWQTVGNIINLIGALIAAALYGNIGLKVLYIEVFQEIFNFPPLTVKRGKLLWAALVPVYWAVAFLIGAAIPQFSYISGFIGAMFILSFTYTLPALLALGFWIKKDAITEEERFDPVTKTYNYQDTGVKRLVRGYMKRPFFNTWNLLYLLGGLVCTALGMYSSVLGMIAGFSGKTVATSFGCASPV